MASRKKELDEKMRAEVRGFLDESTIREIMKEEIRNVIRMVVAKELFGMDIKVVQNAASGRELNYVFIPASHLFHLTPLGQKLIDIAKEQLPILAPKLAVEVTEKLQVSEKLKEAARLYAQEQLDSKVMEDVRSVIWNKTKEASIAYAEEVVDEAIKELKP